MIRVGIIIRASDKWIAGLNYFRNLLYAISKIEGREIQPVLFISSGEDKEIIDSLKPYGEVVKTQILNGRTFAGLLNAGLIKLFNRSFLLDYLFEKNNIDVVSHSSFITCNKTLKTVNWITDFQIIHFPEMFSKSERRYKKLLFLKFATESNAVILSSNDVADDYKRLYPKYVNKARVLRFVSQPDKDIYEIENIKKIEKKYGFSGKFFFLPNQLWKHKNHMVVIKALNLLKKEGKEILVLCTGYMEDRRDTTYVESLMRYIKKNNLKDNIKFLGLIDYKDVLTLMRHCISIINPSFFEGWSSTVEEAKSIGKNIILSDISVHKEQNSPDSVYFNPHNERDLAKKLWNKWQISGGGPDFKLEKSARKNIDQRTVDFGKAYQDIILEVMQFGSK